MSLEFEVLLSVCMLAALYLWSEEREFLFWQAVMWLTFPAYELSKGRLSAHHLWVFWHCRWIACYILINLRLLYISAQKWPSIAALLGGQIFCALGAYANINLWHEFHRKPWIPIIKVLDYAIWVGVAWYCYREAKTAAVLGENHERSEREEAPPGTPRYSPQP